MFTTRPELTGDFGMVASTHWLASATGMSVLERGGNAFDAAVAAGFVLQIAEPHLNGPGGEVPILLWSEAEQKVSVVSGQGVAPAAATVDRFTGLGLDLVPGTGLLAATVPGAFRGWMLMLERWGTWTLADVLEPAISYAENGVPVLERVAGTIGAVEQMFTEDWPTSAATWLPDGRVPEAGSRLANPVLAATYRRLVTEAEAASPPVRGRSPPPATAGTAVSSPRRSRSSAPRRPGRTPREGSTAACSPPRTSRAGRPPSRTP